MGGFRARFEANAGAFGSCRFSFNDTATTEIYTLSLHDALPIYLLARGDVGHVAATRSRDLGEQPKLAGREDPRSEEHTSELQSQSNLVCRLLLEKKKAILQMPRPRDSERAAQLAHTHERPLRGV